MQQFSQIGDFLKSPYGIISMIVSIYVLTLSVINLIYKLKIPRKTERITGPLVSVCIPARDEEHNIGKCLESLVRQTYGNMEIIICDDGSSDKTWEVLKGYSETYPNICIFKGKENPPSWKGKSYAVQQLSEAANGEILYVTDADTIHSPHAVAWAVDRMEERNLDAFTAMPRQLTGTFTEKLVVPVVYIPAFFAPMRTMNNHRRKGATFGIGQLFVYRADAFHAVGGMYSVRLKITDDVAMARVLRGAGYRYEFLDSRGHVECRMYGSFKESVRGFLKNFYEIVSVAPLLIVLGLVTFILTLLVIPPICGFGAVVFGPLHLFQFGTIFILPVTIFIISWGVNLAYYRTPLYMALLYPVFFLVLGAMVVISFIQVLTGKQPVWKTRAVGVSSPVR